MNIESTNRQTKYHSEEEEEENKTEISNKHNT